MRSVMLSFLTLILFTVPSFAAHNFKFVTNPEYYDGEGMRGYSATVDVSGKKYEMVSTCEYYNPKTPAYTVTWFVGNDPIVHNFETLKHRFNDYEYSYNRVTLEFYKLTCGKDKRFKKYLEHPDTNGEQAIN